MRIRMIVAAVAALAAVTLAGCSTMTPRVVTENPLVVPSNDFELVWNKTIAVVDEYFEIASENRRSRKIITQPMISATLLEPWQSDTVGFRNRLEASLQTIHRFAVVTLIPVPENQGGGYKVKVEVHKELEDMMKPDRQTGGRAVFANDFPVNRTREVVGPVPVNVGWIDRGRDPKLEQIILARIRSALFVP